MNRKEAIEILGQYHMSFKPYNAEDIVCAIDMAIEALQERSQGKWIKTSNDWIDGHCGQRFFPYHCGCCGHKTWDDELTNYCPNCGAKMESGEE